MDAGFCIEALNAALVEYGRPLIFNTDQGSPFTSLDFTGVLKDAEIEISMDGRGRWMDNIFIERLWRSLKYEAVYLHELTDGFVAERRHRRVDRLLQYRTVALRPRRPDAGGSLSGPPACGYDGQGSRLAHIPTGPTAAKSIQHESGLGSLIKNRNTP